MHNTCMTMQIFPSPITVYCYKVVDYLTDFAVYQNASIQFNPSSSSMCYSTAE